MTNTAYLYNEDPQPVFRWLVKKDGTKVLQQEYIIKGEKWEIEWRDIPEVQDE